MEYQNLNIKNTSNGKEIFDPIRKKFVILTPEELVRQKTILHLANNKGFPLNLTRVEVGLKVNGLQKRCDILMYNKALEPLLLVECKAEKIKITQEVFNQIARYNLTLKVPYLVVTNGSNTYCCKLDFEKQSYIFLEDIPNFSEIGN